ncbi:MAG: hypothetical protein ACHQJ7_10530, partial [Vicinamibacteria bacterium]
SYILPMFAPLMLVLGPALAEMPARRSMALLAPLTIGAVVVFAGVSAAFDYAIPRIADERTPARLFHAYVPWAVLGTGVVAIAGIVAMLALSRGNERAKTVGIAVMSLGMLAGFQVLFIGHDVFRATRSGYDILREAKNAQGAPLDPNVPFFNVGSYDQTVPFYLGRTTTLVAFRDEFGMGLDLEPQRGIPDEATWVTLWKSLSAGYALVPLDDYRRLVAADVPMRVLATDGRRVLVTRR